ncbi:hypothetical protein H4Q26_012637, partial [Puccinia striiformis f. sp. tritici PST-130]
MSSDSNEKNTTYTKEQSNPVLPPEVEEIARMSSKLAILWPVHSFRRGAILAADPSDLDRLPEITDDERQWVSFESTRQWKQPMTMFYIAVISSMAAIVQGMDEVRLIPLSLRSLQRGLKSNEPRKPSWKSRRWSTVPKSSTMNVLAYRATAQAKGPQRQLQFTLAFGIALGDIVSVIFVDISPDLAWRLVKFKLDYLGGALAHNSYALNSLMLGSTAVAPMLVCMMIFPAPESPRWYMSRGRIADAYKSMCRLRFCELQASRDIFYMAKLLEAEQETTAGRSLFKDLWRVPRVRRAAQSSALVMFMQQFCGVNRESSNLEECFAISTIRSSPIIA